MSRAASILSLICLAFAVKASAADPTPPAADAAPAPAVEQPRFVETAPPSRPIFTGFGDGWAFVGRLGTFVPTLGKFKAFHAANALGIGLRRQLGAVLSVELGAGLISTSTDQVIPATGEYGAEQWTLAELTVAPMTVGARATYRAGPAEVFVAAGGGVYWCQLYKRADVPNVIGYGATSREFQPGLFAATGTGFRLTPSVTLSYEIRYTYLEPTFFGADERIDGLGLTANVAYGF